MGPSRASTAYPASNRAGSRSSVTPRWRSWTTGRSEGSVARVGARAGAGVRGNAASMRGRSPRSIAAVNGSEPAQPLHGRAGRAPVRTHLVDQLGGVDVGREAVVAVDRQRTVAQQ